MATNLNSYQVQNSVLPELIKANEWIQGANNLNLKSILPDLTMYRSYINGLPNNMYMIKTNNLFII
ncbi:MAG: hypothetical protein IJY25_02595 [Bacilli bacterium]|nr:hypothetical protein [Bacilli bacterium]